MFLCSCATLTNSTHTNIKIFTTQPSKIICNQDTFVTFRNKVNLCVQRSKKTLKVVAIADSSKKTFEIKARNSFAFWGNLFLNYGIGMLLDRKNAKRYTYPQTIYLNSSDTINRYFHHNQVKRKGSWHLHISLPHINTFQMTPENESTKINTGFWGLSLGMDYYHRENQFLNVSVAGVSDFFVPVPAAISIKGEYELMSSRYVSFSNNHKIGRFKIGYGLVYAKNTWDFKDFGGFGAPSPTREPVKKSRNVWGVIFPLHFQVTDKFHVGVVYRPTFYIPKFSQKPKYEHLISLDLAWKIIIKNKK